MRMVAGLKPYWRVFYTQPRAEKKSAQRLTEQGFTIFLPVVVEVHQWKDRKKKVVEPLFRNYLFAHVNEAERLWIAQAQGIVRCVTFAGRPAEVSEEEIDQIKIMQRDPASLTPDAYRRFPVGELVTVIQGPFQGLQGEVVDHRGEKHLVVQIHAIQQAVRIHLSHEWLKSEAKASRTSSLVNQSYA